MIAKHPQACGSWDSSLTPQSLIQSDCSYSHMIVPDGMGGMIWLAEGVDDQGGAALMRCNQPGCKPVRLTPAPYHVRSRVHEYGGGEFCVQAGKFWFVEEQGGLYCGSLQTGAIGRCFQRSGWFLADLLAIPDVAGGGVVAVAEDRSQVASPGEAEPTHRLVMITPQGMVAILAEGRDFYASPAFCATTGMLAWLEWDQPMMPWDGAELWSAHLTKAQLVDVNHRAGGPGQPCFQPDFDHQGRLYFASEHDGTDWRLYRTGDDRAIGPQTGECGLPLWQFGLRSYALLDDGNILRTVAQDGCWRLECLIPRHGDYQLVVQADHCVQYQGLRAMGRDAICIGLFADRPSAPFWLRQREQGVFIPEMLTASPSSMITGEDLAQAQPITFPTSAGGRAHGFYYPPANRHFQPLPGEKPPLIVRCHGGPTGQAGQELQLKIQFWTSRGFALLDVNYRGSTGFGRTYRRLLEGKWGEYDVDDVCAGASYLAERGMVDPVRLLIAGSSAGGYTVLAALAFRNLFKAGCSSYGIGDLLGLQAHTHKFESRYLETLLAPLPQGEAMYLARSPVHNPAGFACPMLFLQGLDDIIVPPAQTRAMAKVLDDKKIPHACLYFAGEGHGFRKPHHIEAALQAQLWFYGAVFGFRPAGDPFNLDIRHGEVLARSQ